MNNELSKMEASFIHLIGKYTCREFPPDTAEAGQAKESLGCILGQQNIFMSWLQSLADIPKLECALDKIMPEVRSYFQAENCFLCSFLRKDFFKSYTSQENYKIPSLQNVSEEVYRKMSAAFAGNKQLIVCSTAELESDDPESFALLQENGIRSFAFTPVLSHEKLWGMIGLVNLKANFSFLPMVRLLAAGLSSSIQRYTTQNEKLEMQFVDSLTGILNFDGFKIEVQRLLNENPTRPYAFWYCDIRKFKFINDVFGYGTGDRLLKHWADFLTSEMQDGETCCRVSADNMVFFYWYHKAEDIQKRFEKMVKTLSEFKELAVKRFNVELVSGIYLIQNNPEKLSIVEMINRANIAQKSVKKLPGSQFALFTDEMRQKEIYEMQLLADARRAIKQGEFKLYMQPQLCIQKKAPQTIRAEVLVRWAHPKNGLMMPDEFIPLFEQNGIIVDLDHYMFERTCQYLADIYSAEKTDICLTVNVSRITLFQPGFLEDFCRLKELYAIPNGCLELEFTENGVVEDFEYCARLIEALKQNGFLCTMDDFGRGQSSLNILQNLPLDVLKLDRTFFDGSHSRSSRTQTIISSVLRMAKLLSMVTVAEGIEFPEQVKLLEKMGCDYIQGYIYSKPIPAEKFKNEFLRDTNRSRTYS